MVRGGNVGQTDGESRRRRPGSKYIVNQIPEDQRCFLYFCMTNKESERRKQTPCNPRVDNEIEKKAQSYSEKEREREIGREIVSER